MPDWLVNLLAAVFGAGGVGAIASWHLRAMENRHKAEMDQLKAKRLERGDEAKTARADRADEIDVLQQAITELRGDRDALKAELAKIREAFDLRWAERDEAFNHLKDEHTACKITLERVQASHEFLTQRIAELERRVGNV